MSAENIIRKLELEPHPEGGWYRQTWAGPDIGGRASGTAILFLLRADERSHWHRVDADEMWHHYAGAALRLDIAIDGEPAESVQLGPDLAAGQRPQALVPAHAWQAAESEGDWTLVGCTVAPAFEFAGFEMAPPGWTPR